MRERDTTSEAGAVFRQEASGYTWVVPKQMWRIGARFKNRQQFSKTQFTFMTVATDIDEITTEDRDEARFQALESRALKGTYYIVAFDGLALGILMRSIIVL